MNCDRFKCSLQRRHTVFVTTIELKLFGQSASHFNRVMLSTIKLLAHLSFLTAREKTLGCQSCHPTAI